MPAFTFFCFYRKVLGPKYCGMSSLRPTSYNLLNQVLDFFFFFFFFFFLSFFKTIFYFTDHLNFSIIGYYLSFFRQEGVGGGGGKIPWPGQLAPHSRKSWKLKSERLFKYFRHNFLMLRCWISHITAFINFSLYRKVLGPN